MIPEWQAHRHKIPEGLGLTEWPEFKAMMKRFSLIVPQDADFAITFPPKGGKVVLKVNNTVMTSVITTQTAWMWPETKAWMDRLGIPWHMWIIDITIQFAPKVFPTFVMTAALSDSKE